MAFVSLGSSLPSIEVTIDFDNNPSSTTLTWTDVTPYVREVFIRRGRDNELAAADPGVCELTLDNTDRRFDPTNTSSPLSPNVKPMRRVRVRCQWASVTYNLFRGYVEDWPLEWPELGKDALVRVRATDALKVLNLYDLDGKSYAAQRSDLRLGTVLFDAGFESSEYSLRTGINSVVASGTFVPASYALSHVQDVVAAETGILFVDGGGTIQFQDKQYRGSLSQAGTISDASGGIQFREPVGYYGERKLFNRAVVTPSGGTAETSVSTASTALYYTRTVTKDSLVNAQNDALSDAQYITFKYGSPYLEVEEIEILGGAATATWPTILAREISDYITLEFQPKGGGTISETQFIEQIGFDIRVGGEWITRWRSSNGKAGQYWQLDSATRSQLDSTTVLG